MTNPTENYMTPLNWRKGLMRLWLLCASGWLLAAPFWTNLPDELRYAFRYATERDALRSDLLARGACLRTPNDYDGSPNPYDAVVEEYFGLPKIPRADPAKAANAAEEACQANNRVTRIDAYGIALPKENCAAVFLDAYDREKRAGELEKKRQAEAAERESNEAEKRCKEVFTPEPPKFHETLVVLGIPTLGVAAAVLMLMAVVRVFRWVGRGFVQS